MIDKSIFEYSLINKIVYRKVYSIKNLVILRFLKLAKYT